MEERTTPWRKATASGGNGGSCLEVRRDGNMIKVRDTKAGPGAPIQEYRPDEWAAFLDGAKKGEFDDLI